jgi:hypothetical protein
MSLLTTYPFIQKTEKTLTMKTISCLHRNFILAVSGALLTTCLGASFATAETYTCALTGYTFMGGGSAYVSTAESHEKTYFLAQPLNYDYSGANYWGYGWIKFDDIGDATVESATLRLNLLGLGSMNVIPATEENPAILDIYGAGSVDVADLVGGEDAWDLRETLRDNLDALSPLYTVTITENGPVGIDITGLYNSWVTGETANNGIVLSTVDNGTGSKYSSFGDAAGAPYIVAVPEPGTTALVAMALMGLGIARLLRRQPVAGGIV